MGIDDASEKKLILAVVGCQEKIAHTDMAAEALEKQALEMGCEIKVEARGTDGCSLCRYLAPFGLGVLFGLGIYSLGKYVMLLFG